MIAVTFALPAESSELQRRLRDAKIVHRGGRKINMGWIGGREIQIFHTGVGLEMARTRILQYLDTASPSLLISSGFAGAIRSHYRVGDLLLAENFCDPGLLTTARRVLREQNVHTAKMLSAAKMIDSAEEREEVWRRHEAAAIDMETEAIADVCASRGLRMLSLRVLSDTPQHPFPLPAEILFDIERQKTPSLRLIKYLTTHPAAVPRLVRFGGQINRARGSLTRALVTLLGSEL
jgi:adenosylhomocysteine nucleosidase